MKKLTLIGLLLFIAIYSKAQVKISAGYSFTMLTHDEAKDIYDKNPKGFNIKGLLGIKDFIYGGIFYDNLKGECNGISWASESFEGEATLKYEMRNWGFECNTYLTDRFYLLGRIGKISWEERAIGDVRSHKETIDGSIYSLGGGVDIGGNKGFCLFAEAHYNWTKFDDIDVDGPFDHWKINLGITYRLKKTIE